MSCVHTIATYHAFRYVLLSYLIPYTEGHMAKAQDVKKCLHKYARREKISVYRNFFKTGPGEYGEGDVFIGVTVPDTRRVAKKFLNLSFIETKRLLRSDIHEERLCGILILVERFKSSDDAERKRIVDYYLAHTEHVNNWDLVDLSADKILGGYLIDRPRNVLKDLAKSELLWDRRIAIISTFTFIRKGDLDDTFAISDVLLYDDHDLIHKAVGWMLREAGKRDRRRLEAFLKPRYKKMPRTMLRYAIERFPEQKRQRYLKGDI